MNIEKEIREAISAAFWNFEQSGYTQEAFADEVIRNLSHVVGDKFLTISGSFLSGVEPNETKLNGRRIFSPVVPKPGDRIETSFSVRGADGETAKATGVDYPTLQPYQKPLFDLMATLPKGCELKLISRGGRLYIFATSDGRTMSHRWDGREWMHTVDAPPSADCPPPTAP